MASTSTIVHFFRCADNGGQATVPAGSMVTFQSGWVTANRGLDEAFLNAVTVTASVNGTQIPNANSYWGAPEPFTPPEGGTAWVTFWTYPTGITLGAGQSLTFTTDWTLSHQIASGDVIPPKGGTLHISAGSMFGTISCTVTGA